MMCRLTIRFVKCKIENPPYLGEERAKKVKNYAKKKNIYIYIYIKFSLFSDKLKSFKN